MDTIRRKDLKPLFNKYPLLCRAYGLVLLLISPVLVPVASIVDNRYAVKDYYREAFRTLFAEYT